MIVHREEDHATQSARVEQPYNLREREAAKKKNRRDRSGRNKCRRLCERKRWYIQLPRGESASASVAAPRVDKMRWSSLDTESVCMSREAPVTINGERKN